jgi:hypothetical protein
VPVRGGADFLRIGVRDVSSNRFGVVEMPIAAVAHLAPLPAAAFPQAQPAKLGPGQKQ